MMDKISFEKILFKLFAKRNNINVRRQRGKFNITKKMQGKR